MTLEFSEHYLKDFRGILLGVKLGRNLLISREFPAKCVQKVTKL